MRIIDQSFANSIQKLSINLKNYDIITLNNSNRENTKKMEKNNLNILPVSRKYMPPIILKNLDSISALKRRQRFSWHRLKL
jgi:hypothetical protein